MKEKNKNNMEEINAENNVNVNKTKKKNRKTIIAVILIAIIAFSAFRIITSKDADVLPQSNDKSVNVRTSQVTRMDIEVMTPLTGRIQPVQEASIVPAVAGKVTKVHVSLGKKVSIDTPLFELDKEQMQNTYNQALAGYNQANASYTNAKSNFERVKLLYQENAVSKQQYEQAQLQHDAAYQSLIQTQASLSNAKKALDNCIVKSPINGYVTLINVNEGEMASQAMPAVAVANIDTVEIETSISENMINKIKIGDNVKVLVKSASDTEFEGIISELSPAPAQGSLTYPLKISISNSDTLIKSGMFAEIKIVSESKKNVLAVPSDAVIIKNGTSMVATLHEDTAVFKKVTVGIDNTKNVEIIDGLQEGDIIITEGQYYLDDGSKVNVIQ